MERARQRGENQQEATTRRWFEAAILFLLVALLPGCGVKSARAPESPPRREVARMGYSIQLGAFSDVRNARRLSESLDRQGYDAFYFRDPSGLFKVCFGNFSTAERARSKGDELIRSGVITGYQIVRPEDYSFSKLKILGVQGLRREIVATAESFLGISYQWGGRSPEEGFDCSGLAMAVYQLNGLNLPRTSGEQFLAGTAVSRAELNPGDLVFFATKGKKVTHVGLYAGEGKFIHAPGSGKPVRTDLLGHGYFSRRYMGGRTYL